MFNYVKMLSNLIGDILMFKFLHKIKVLEYKVDMLTKKVEIQQLKIDSLISTVTTSTAVLNSIVNPKPIPQPVVIDKSSITKSVKPFPTEKIKTTGVVQGNHVTGATNQRMPTITDNYSSSDYSSSSSCDSSSSSSSSFGGCD